MLSQYRYLIISLWLFIKICEQIFSLPSRFHSVSLHSTPSILFHSILSQFMTFYSTPLHDLGHAQFGLELCDLTSPSTSMKVFIYQPLMGSPWGPYVHYFDQYVAGIISLIPTKPREVHALASSLMGKLIHAQWLRVMHLSHKTDRSQIRDMTPKVRTGEIPPV